MSDLISPFANPFRPGAGHPPPYLAGRTDERAKFARLLKQTIILENMVLTGLRGVGKTVLLDSLFRPLAQESGWAWVGTEISESVSVSEQALAIRIMTDLSIITSGYTVEKSTQLEVGFTGAVREERRFVTYDVLEAVFNQTPGLVSDKLKGVLRFAWAHTPEKLRRGIIFAYDESQNLTDHAEKDQYPFALLLDVFQSIQKQTIPYMLVLAGLPILSSKLVETRTYSERMFRVLFLDKLNRHESREAITKPIQNQNCPIKFTEESVETICDESDGYPYFVQFMCREVYEAWISQIQAGQHNNISVPINEITKKLDSDFFAARWESATDRQREVLSVIAHLPESDKEFTINDVSKSSEKLLKKPLSGSHINQMLKKLSEQGLIYKNRRGKYSFAVPLLDRFIKRQHPLTESGALFDFF